MATVQTKYVVKPLDAKQIQRLEFCLNDWKDSISPDDSETQKIVIDSILESMKCGVLRK